tara:strand:+ start:368 stop:472 length:105 start_codon:yes stop_codon:yes gene_type:complete
MPRSRGAALRKKERLNFKKNKFEIEILETLNSKR